MGSADSLNLFVRDALSEKRSRSEIRKALDSAGWSNREIDKALKAFADVNFSPPIPRPVSQLVARDFFIYSLMFMTLGFTAVFLTNLIHGILDIWLPDSADNRYRIFSATNSIRWAISVLVVSAPTFVWLTVKAGPHAIRRTGKRQSLTLKWLTYLTLFVSALVFLGDASTVIYNFLKDELTLRFILKAVTVASISAVIFTFYLRNAEDDEQ